MQVITFPGAKASVNARSGQEGVLLSLFRSLDPDEQEIVLNVVKITASHHQRKRPAKKPPLVLV